MQITIENIKEVFNNQAIEMFGVDLNCPIIVNRQLKHLHGRYSWDKKDGNYISKNIEIGSHHVRNGKQSDVLDTVKHELLHWYLYDHMQIPHRHDSKVWLEQCQKHGVKHTKKKKKRKGKSKHTKKEYNAFCLSCRSDLFKSGNRRSLYTFLSDKFNDGGLECPHCRHNQLGYVYENSNYVFNYNNGKVDMINVISQLPNNIVAVYSKSIEKKGR